MRAEEAALVGRERELAQLDDAVATAARGRGRTVVVRGEAGIGKSRLAREGLRRAAEHGFEVLAGAAEEMEQRRPFGALAEALGVEREHDRSRAEIRRLLRGGGAAPAGVLLDSAVDEFRVAELIVEFLEARCTHRRVALLVEDLHWADPSSLLAVHRIAQVATELRLLVLCTLRPFPERRELRALLGSIERAGGLQVELEPLGAEAVTALATEITGAAPGWALKRRLEGVGGNPLFVVELLEALASEPTPDALGDGSLPPSLRLTILRRLSGLPDDTLAVLRTASALGSSFAVADVAVGLRRPIAAVAEVLRPALRANVLAERGDRLAFRHDAIREALYEDMPLAVRRPLHRELGSALVQAGAPIERIAAQMLRGGEPGDVEAIEWLRQAGRDAAPRAPAVAVELLEGALALAPADAPYRQEIRTELIAPLAWAGRGADVEAVCREALAADRGGGPGGDPFRLGLARGLFSQGRLLEARAEFERIAHSRTLGESERQLVAAFDAYLGAFLGVEEATGRAEALLNRIQDGPAAAIARLALVSAALFGGRPDLALERLDALARAGAADWLPVRLLRGIALLDVDRLDDARATLREAARTVTRVGASGGPALLHVMLVTVEYCAGELDRALAEHATAVELAEESGQRWLIGAHAVRARIAVDRGELEMAERALEAADAERAAVGPQLGVAVAPLARASLAEARGDRDAARAAALEAWELARSYHLRSHLAWFAPHVVRIALAAGDRDSAEAVGAVARQVADGIPVASWTAGALHCRGLLDHDPGALLEAVDALRRTGRKLELALGLESAALELARARREDEARAHGREALALYAAANAGAAAERARSRLRAAGLRLGAVGPRGRPRWGWESLTEAELRVVRLVAQGHSNPVIAERLYLTRRTVRAHVSSALRKLDLASRVELAAEAVRRGL